MNKDEASRLKAPGLGLPVIQELVLKFLMFPIYRHKLSWEQAQQRFLREGLKIQSTIATIPPALRTKRVLIPPTMGIEDSSRYWSLAMTLDHMLIVTHGVLALMHRLSRGESITTVVDTASVKPNPVSAHDTEERFAELLVELPQQLAGIQQRYTAKCHEHPWFGCLNPHGWLVMLAIHQYVHRRQVEQISKQLTEG